MALEIDFIPALAGVQRIINHDINFLAFNSMLLGVDDSLNTDEQTFSQDDDGTWSVDKISRDALTPLSLDKIQLRYVIALPYFFPSMQTAMRTYRDAILNLRIFGKYYKKS